MKIFFVLVVAFLIAQVNGDWVLVWEDDFEGGSLNKSNWNIADNFTLPSNGELEMYVTWNAFVN